MTDMGDISDYELNKLLNDKKHHKELLIALGNVASTIKDQDARALIERNQSHMASVFEKMTKIDTRPPEIKMPDVNVSTDHSDVIAAINQLIEEIKKPKNYSFKIIRDNYSKLVKEIIAEQK